MELGPRQRAKLARFVRFGGLALIAAWSLVAIIAYAATAAISGWLAQTTAADGWLAWSGQIIGQAGGPVIALAWVAGALAILALATLLRRLVA